MEEGCSPPCGFGAAGLWDIWFAVLLLPTTTS